MIYDLQKASIMKRISAFLLDFILATIVFTGALWIFSSILNYDAQIDIMDDRRQAIESEYGIPALSEKYEVSLNDYQGMSQEERNVLPTDVQQIFSDCINEINNDSKYNQALAISINLILIMLSFSLLFAVLVTEFIIPLVLKNGQTVGKKIFSLAVMRTDGIKIAPTLLFIRSVLGKYTIELMLPVLMVFMVLFFPSGILPIIVLLVLLIIEVILIIATRTNSLIHDSLSSTVVVDFSSQMIFDSVEAKQEYQRRIHEEEKR